MRAPLGEVVELYRDGHLLVLVKPAGLPTTSPDGGDCLAARASALDPGAPALHALSRLDAMVTGLVPFARTREMNRVALAARREGAFERCYVALTLGAPVPDSGDWRWPIAMHPRDKKLRVALDPGEPGERVQAGHTRYATAAGAGALHVLHLWPQTGRTHQLRVHAARAGVPLLGDVAYGGARRLQGEDGSVWSSKRVQLHCAWLRLPQPGRAEPLTLQAEALQDMLALWCGQGGQADALSGRAAARL